MKQLRSLLVAVLTLTGLTAAFAQPANDPFSAPVVLTGTSISIGGTTTSATKETNEPNHAGNTGGHSVWYEWSPTVTASVTMTCNGSTYRTLLAAYTGSAVNALTGIASSVEPNGGGVASITFTATSGTSYKIAVDGRNGTSGTFTLTVNQAVGPVVTLTAPNAGQIFTNPAAITLSAAATSPVGAAITNVSFFYGGSTLIGSDTNVPFSIVWSNMNDGNYTLTARATDNAGLTTTSAGRAITIRPVGYFSGQIIGSNSISGSNSVWTYKDDGSDQGTAWRDLGFDDSSWASGPGQLGYGDGDEATVVNSGPAGAFFPTTYFRHTFTVNNASFITNLVARFLRDDGVVAYLNGVEVIRNNMTNGQDYLSYTANATDDGNTFFSTNINPSLLTNGLNVFAAELHQNAPSSSDVTWYLELTGTGANGNPAPSVAITSPTNGAILSAGSSLVLNATASDPNGTVTNVAFYANGTNYLGNDTTSPYSVTWNSVPEGDYTLTAIATDDQGASTISVGVNITVNSYTVAPVTLIASNSVWKYLDDGTDQGTAWSAAAFNDTSWASGPGELGYGDLPEGRPEATVLCCSNAVSKFITYYFRKTFVVDDASAVSNLVLHLMRDDGAVVYLNGVEQWRDNMPAGTITAATLASAAVSGAAEATYYTNTFGPTNLVSGDNVLAVEVHQNATSSSDLSFDLDLIANTLNIILPTNTAAPFVASQNPVAGATVGTLTSVQVVFSESVSNVNATDLLINGTPAAGLSGGPTTYTFTFAQPPLGPVAITWAVGHGIMDRNPAPLPFDATTNIWSYNLADVIAPTITAKNPAAGASVTNLTSIDVTFSENVTGVNASDLLVNGTPAGGLVVNTPANYTFTFGQPVLGTVNINWASGHGITDTSPSANAFNTNSAGANWQYTLTVPSSIIIPSNTVWKFIKGFAEASAPVQAWRQIGFDDSSWTDSPTPFYYGDPYTNTTTGVGTLLDDMNGAYQCIYLRHEFTLVSPAAVSNFVYRHQSDDGFVAWINGVEVLRYGAIVPTDPPYNLGNFTATSEPNNNGAAYISVTNTAGLGALLTGTNILAVQAFNANLSGSTDFGLDLEFGGTIVELNPSNLPPRIFASAPVAGDVFTLTSINVVFSEPVVGVEENDLLINGTPADGYSGSGSNYTFTFTQPAYGPVAITWAVGHNIFDFDAPPKPFNATAGGATWNYTLVNPNAPVIASQVPAAAATLSALTSVQVTFNKNVTGVNATDLLISGTPASGMAGSGSNYTFTFIQPPYGNVGISWAGGHGIFATGSPADTFDPTRAGNTWSYTLVDLTPPVIIAKNPPAGANVTNLTSLSVTFSENVTGVNAADLLINNVPATGVSGSGANYTFTFAQPNTSIANISWDPGHDIIDTAGNPFDGASATWQYFTPDNVAPVAALTSPFPGATLRDLTSIQVTFSEPVTGVSADDLIINAQPASGVSGSAAGPYTFIFNQPATGTVEIIWAGGHGITDLAAPPNNFAGGEWTYRLDPNAVFADKIVINEIMYLPLGGWPSNEWIELKNIDTAPMNLNGWRFSKGLDYTFPNVTIPAGGYLVVAADTNAFRLKYPGVTNYVGPYTGNLANNGETLQLETATGENVNEVEYATEGDWAVRQRGLVQSSYRGWIWNQPADGRGPSLELMNSALPNAYGQNWKASTATNGTPGAANATARTNIPPMILDTVHTPAVPRTTDPIVISARILDERTNGLSVTLFYRNASTVSPPAFTSLAMFDDGAHNDGLNNDKIWAATIPVQTDKTVIEFYVRAVDLDNNTNYWPAVAYAAADQGSALLTPQTSANAVFQVDDTIYTFAQPQYRLTMIEQERIDRLASTGNAEFNGSFISIDGTGTEVRYNASFRERGAGSRGVAEPANQRVNIPTDRRWKGQREFNLNTQFTHSQYAGYLLSRKAGLDTEYSRIVRVYINGNNAANAGSPQFGCYIHNEAVDSELVAAHWPQDDGGNIYRLSTGNHTANLNSLQPPTSQTYSNAGYLKASNSAENDYTDVTNLTYVLNIVPNSIYEASVRSNVNVENWLLYFAMNTLLANAETSIGTGFGDDGGLYHAPLENKFYMYAHDWDSVLGFNGSVVNQSIMVATALPAVSKFLTWTNFARDYTNTLRRLCQTSFSPGEAARTLDEGLTGFADTATINAMKQFVTNRVANVLSQLPSPDTNAIIVASTNIGGTISANTVFAAAGANTNYFITSTLTIASGATLTVQPGVNVRLASGANITVANGGRLLAEGTAAQPILFTRSGGANWGSITINGGAGSPESRIAYARIEFNVTSTGTPAIDVAAGTAWLDHLTFGNTASPYIHVDGASFVIGHCEFPTITAQFEPVHGTGGVKAGGRGIFYRNWFGQTIGYNDTVDFTGGNRPGSPIVQFIDNVFTGSQDDILDLDGTDAWVEGNIFLHAHRLGSPDSSSAVSGGDDSGQTSEITVLGNIFYDVDQAATAKQLNFYTFMNNTVAHQNGAGFDDAGVTAVLNFADAGIASARGMYVEGNILYDIERITRNVTNGTAVASNTTFNGNLMPFSWAGPGATNSTAVPVFAHVPTVAETTNFTNWASAQVLRDWFTLQPGSPGLGSGPNGGNRGVVPMGAAVAVGAGVTTNDATFTVGMLRNGGAIAASGGFPSGSGYTHYKWRLDGGVWSGETPVGTVLGIPGFQRGTHRLEVVGKRDSGTYQDDADMGELAVPTVIYSRNARRVRLNEVLAANSAAVNHAGTFPDIIELYNEGTNVVDLGGLRLTDDKDNPDKFIFDQGTTLGAGAYLVVYANNEDGTPGIHTGFALSKDGQSVHLYDSVDNGGTVLDSVKFGLQLTDYSVGRVGTNWVLCVPTAGGANVAAATGPAAGLVINEILAAELVAFPDDFVELYNGAGLPVALGGLYFTDNPPHWPDRSPVPPLTFIGPGGFLAFHADGNTDAGSDHLSFALEAERGLVALLNTDFSIIDCVLYGPQTTDISQGRVPQNIFDNNFFTTPTPGAPNQGLISTNSGVVLNEILAANSSIAELDGSAPDWIELYNLSATNVNLGDYSLSDASVTPRKYVFAPGTIISGNGYLRIRCDGDIPAGPTNTGFNIKAEGGSVYLFGPLAQGGALLNAVTYGLQAVDFSIGRINNGTGPWTLTLPTPNGANIPATLASANAVKVNEWMAAPSSGEDWFELWNPNNQPVAIGGYYTSDDSSPAGRTKSPIPALSYLGASTNGYQRFWADSSPADGANHANFKFSAGGESVAFSSPGGVLIDYTNFGAQATGVSEGRFPDGSSTIVRFPGTESPGEANYLLITNVVINEALTHTDPPLEDAIELRNLTAAPVSVLNWWLSDAKGTPRKYRITNAVAIPANGFVVFYETQFNNGPLTNFSAFSLSSAKGDQVYLSTGDAGGNLTGYRTSVDFGAAQNGWPFGRYVTSDGREEFVTMSARSFGQDDPPSVAVFRTGTGKTNPYPRVGPVVIAQIMYHPPDVGTNDNTVDEFIELRNMSGSAQELYDPLASTNTWRLRDGVDYDFPPGVSMPANTRLVVVSFDPVSNPGQLAAFRTKYAVDGTVPIYGPYTGKLANSDDKVELYKPDNPDAGFVPYVLVDRVHYHDSAPWPVAADGGGAGLARVSVTGFGNDPTNWAAVVPNFGGGGDTDGDGMPDWWEVLYGLEPNNPADANLDADGDGMTNLQEFIAGTDPRQAGSALRLFGVEALGAGNTRMFFNAISNRSYSILYKNGMVDPVWSKLFDVSAVGTNRVLQINTSVGTNRFFWLRTPQAP